MEISAYFENILDGTHQQHGSHAEIRDREESRLYGKKAEAGVFWPRTNHEKYRLLQLVIVQGKVDSKRGPGRRRHSWFYNLRQWFGLSSVDLFRSAVNKIRIAMLIANVGNG